MRSHLARFFCVFPRRGSDRQHKNAIVRTVLLLFLNALPLALAWTQSDQCSISISATPSPALLGQPVTITATLNGDVVVDTVTGSFLLDGTQVCTLAQGPSSCSATVTPSFGWHVFTWSCTAVGTGGNGQNSGSQGFQVGRIIDKSFFGMHLNTLSDPDQASLNVRFGTLRLWGSFGTAWYNISPQPGPCQPPTPSCFDWTTLDAFLDWAQSYNYDVIYTLGAPPCWVSSQPNCFSDPSSSSQWATTVDHLDDWENFVKALVAHVAARPAGRIKYYELWNEPTISAFWTGGTGLLANMAQMAFQDIKSIDPQALVLTPSPTGDAASIGQWMDQYMTAVQTLPGSTGVYADGVAFHSYQGAVPENVLPVIQNLQVTETNHRVYLPLLDTEGSWGLDSSGNETVTDPDEQAAFVARTYALQASTVDRFAWYGWDFCVKDGNCWGTLWMRPPSSGPCPPDCGPVQLKSGMAYGTITDWLIGAQITLCSNAQGNWTCPIYRPNGYQGQISWSVNSDPFSYTVPPPFTQSRDLLTNCPQPIQNQQVTLGHKPLLVETPYPGSSGSAACWWEAVQSISP